MKKGAVIALVVAILGIVLALSIGYVTTANEPSSNIIVSSKDTRTFKTLTLDNGLKVAVVSDPNSLKSAVSMTVFSGAWSQPTQVPFSAEFLQHLVLMGSEQYPQADSFTRFVTQHGGTSIYQTEAESTHFAFDVHSQQLEEAINRFSQLFIAPTLDALNAQQVTQTMVNQQWRANNDTVKRIEDVLAFNGSGAHPMHTLSVAPLPTADESVLAAATEFYRTHYVANNMALAIVGPQSITKLETLAITEFSALRSVPINKNVAATPLYATADLPMLLEVNNASSAPLLQFRFPINNNPLAIEALPSQFIAYLLADESQRSLMSELRDRGLATHIRVDPGSLAQTQTEFTVSIGLTHAGVEQWQTIGELLFANLAFILEQGINESTFQQWQTLNQLRFEYANQQTPLTQAQRLSRTSQYALPERLLVSDSLPAQFSSEAIMQRLRSLQPDNVVVVLSHANTTGESLTPTLSVPHKRQLLGGNTLAQWRSASPSDRFTLPGVNPFAPTNTDMLPFERELSNLIEFHPQRIAINENTVVWFEQDDRHLLPKADVHLLIETPAVAQGPEQQVATDIYIALVSNALASVHSTAHVAGTEFDISRSEKGILVWAHGFSDRIQLLLDALIVELTDYNISNEMLQTARETYIDQQNANQLAPLSDVAIEHLNLWLSQGEFTVDQKIDAANALTKSDLESIRQLWFTESQLTFLIHGNVSQTTALALAERIDNMIPQQGLGDMRATVPVAQIPQRAFLSSIVSAKAQGSLLQYYQGSNSSLREQALFQLLGFVIRQPFEAEVRDSELGYFSNTFVKDLSGKPGLVMMIESDHTDAALLTLYANRFYAQYRQQLLAMSDAEFNRYKEGLVVQLQQPSANLTELSHRYWQNIMISNANFNSLNRLAHEVKTISLDGFIRFYENQILGNETRNLTIHQVPADMREDYREHMKSVVGLFPLETPKDWPEDVKWVTPTFNNLPR